MFGARTIGPAEDLLLVLVQVPDVGRPQRGLKRLVPFVALLFSLRRLGRRHLHHEVLTDTDPMMPVNRDPMFGIAQLHDVVVTGIEEESDPVERVECRHAIDAEVNVQLAKLAADEWRTADAARGADRREARDRRRTTPRPRSIRRTSTIPLIPAS